MVSGKLDALQGNGRVQEGEEGWLTLSSALYLEFGSVVVSDL